MIEMTVDYVKERQQFGVPVGSFQAVKHHLADARIALEFARPLVYRAAASIAAGDPDTARARVDGQGQGRRRRAPAGRAALQCHGAIGYTTEYDLHLYMKRAWALAAQLGRRAVHRGRVAPRDPVATRREETRCPRHTSSTRCAARSAGAAAGSRACTRPTSARTRSARSIERTGVDPAAVDDVVFGCVDTIGPQAGDIARTCWLVAGLPDEVPGTTVDRQCGSSQQAVHFAAQAVMSGTSDLVVAGGVQNMSAIPISAAMLAGEQYGFENPFAGRRAGKRATARRRCRSSARRR